jgi:hypothetical protein
MITSPAVRLFPPGGGRSARLAAVASEDESEDELERQIHERYGTWRDAPPGPLGCLAVLVFTVLTTGAVILAMVRLLR